MSNGLEKRKLQRLEFPLEVTVEVLSAEEVPKGPSRLHVKSRNISKDGICIETKFLEVDGINLLSGRPGARENRLHLSIALIPDEPRFEATGELCWYDVAHDKADFMYHIGIEFIGIKESQKEQLARFLKKYRSDSLKGRLADLGKFWRK